MLLGPQKQSPRSGATATLLTNGCHGGADRGGGTDWTIVYEDGARFEPTPSYRTVRVHAVSGVEEVAAVLTPEARSIEAIGLDAKGRERLALAAALAATGAPRIAALGSLQRPALFGTHGGVHRLLPFLHWSTVELGTGKRTPRPAKKPKRPRR